MRLKYTNLATLFTLGLLTLPGLAQAVTGFTLAQAEANCPSINNLLFTQLNPIISNGAGNITGTMNGVNFFTNNPVVHPQNLTPNNMVVNAQFRYSAAISGYGYISGNNIVCLYSYPTFTGASYQFILQTVK